ncbi:MAG TPA: multicopper oxidase domain-containing protein [Nitrososphaerales archaeon]|nr:multicopper oxidase domain-containing protein [Nitrososphaerales archaeon]
MTAKRRDCAKYRRFRSAGRRAASEATFAGILASATLVFIVIGVAFSSQSSSQLEQIRSLQGQLASASSTASSASTTQTTSSAAPPPVAPTVPTVRHITLIAEPAVITLATNVTYDAWTFNGTVPGPTIFANLGDTIVAKFINNFTTMAHSIDFHAGQVNWAADYQPVAPGQSITFNFTVDYPGVFMYHCGTSPAIEHIANGMYGAFVVNPSTPLPPATGGQYVLVQSEFFLNDKPGADGHYAGNYSNMLAGKPTYVVFNASYDGFVTHPLPVQPNKLVRLYILDAGPSEWSAFHVIGALMNTTYIDGDPANAMYGLQTLNIPPSGGAIVDMYFQDPGGKNPFVTHQFEFVPLGDEGVFAVGATTTTSTTSSSSGPAAQVHVSIPQGSELNTASPGYSPAAITVVIGVNNTVEWINNDVAPHTVTSASIPAGATKFDSGYMNIEGSGTFTYTFTVPGTYQYGCSYHPWMHGTVIVKAAGG